MNIAVLSGKGGAGKTFISTNLAYTASVLGRKTCYADCDAEEPNGHIFLKPGESRKYEAGIKTPVINSSKCTGCRKCADHCEFNAIIVIKGKAKVFDELCHGCGACAIVCSEQAVKEQFTVTGDIIDGKSNAVPGLRFIEGRLRVGKPMPVPVIEKIEEILPSEGDSFLDSPPGASCPVVETASFADYVVIAAEPTPFGINDMAIAVDLLSALDKKFSIIINRSNPERDRIIEDYCREKGCIIIGKIPDRIETARIYSEGSLAAEKDPETYKIFSELLKRIYIEAGRAK